MNESSLCAPSSVTSDSQRVLLLPLPLTPAEQIWFTSAGISLPHDLFRMCAGLSENHIPVSGADVL